MYKKLKSLLDNDTLFLCGVMILVAAVCFLLGRASVVQVVSTVSSKAPVMLISSTTTAVLDSAPIPEQASASSSGAYVASKSGSKFHHVTCSGAAQIKEENKIYFASVLAAEAAGYSRAANCTK